MTAVEREELERLVVSKPSPELIAAVRINRRVGESGFEDFEIGEVAEG